MGLFQVLRLKKKKGKKKLMNKIRIKYIKSRIFPNFRDHITQERNGNVFPVGNSDRISVDIKRSCSYLPHSVGGTLNTPIASSIKWLPPHAALVKKVCSGL